jgi:hypothetical protein
MTITMPTAAPAIIAPPKEEEQNTSLVFSPLDRLVTAWGKAETQATEATIRRGVLLHRYLVRSCAGLSGSKRRTARADALDAAHDRLTAEGYDSNCSRFLKIYAVASLLGVQAAASVSAATLREFAPLVKRLADDEDYQFSHDAETRALWTRTQADRLGPTAIHSAVAAILGREPRPAAHRTEAAELARHADKSVVADFVENLSDEMQDYLAGLIR